MRFLTLFLIITFLMPQMALAKGSVNVGDIIPHSLTLKDQKGKTQSFSNLSGEKGLVLAFVRSVEWCPYCQKQVIELDKNKQKFNDLGYNVATVSYDPIEQMSKFVTTNKPSITLLSDPSSESIRAFGILNENSAKGTMSYGIPYPGVYIIDNNKKVQAKFFEEGYQNRPSARKLLVKIESLNAPVVEPMTMESMGTDPIDPNQAFVEIPQEALLPIIEGNVETAPALMEETEATGVPESIVPPTTPAIEAPVNVEPIEIQPIIPDASKNKIMPADETVIEVNPMGDSTQEEMIIDNNDTFLNDGFNRIPDPIVPDATVENPADVM